MDDTVQEIYRAKKAAFSSQGEKEEGSRPNIIENLSMYPFEYLSCLAATFLTLCAGDSGGEQATFEERGSD